MNQALLVIMLEQFPGSTGSETLTGATRAGPMCGAQPMSEAYALAEAIVQRGPRSALAIGSSLHFAPRHGSLTANLNDSN
jgi:hypothetical protein